jgi:hypothetical protein
MKNFGNGNIVITNEIFEINQIKLKGSHSNKKLFVKIDNFEQGIVATPMLNSKNYHEIGDYKDYIHVIKPDNINNLKNDSYINCASEVYFINIEDCENINKIGELSKDDLLDVQQKIIHARIKNIPLEVVNVEFTKKDLQNHNTAKNKNKLRM